MKKSLWITLLGVSCVLSCALALASCNKTTNTSTDSGVKIQTDSNGLQYHLLDDGTFAVALDSGAQITALEIPETYNGTTVSALKNEAFMNSALQTVVIPDTVTTIGEYAFFGCKSLTNLVIPDTVTTIGACAVGECTSLSTITVPFIGKTKSNTGDDLFKTIFGTTDVYDTDAHLPSSLKTIIITQETTVCARAFYRCYDVTTIVLPDTVTTIEADAFALCTSLQTINIPDGITFIDGSAFNRCESLQYNEKDGLSFLGNAQNKYAYLVRANASELGEITLPSGCKGIHEKAFYNRTDLVKITLSDIVYIGESAFEGCSNLLDIHLPASLSRVLSNAFKGCDKLLIYCTTKTKPIGWLVDWNYSNRPVRWGYSG